MPLPAISRWKHPVFGLSVHPPVVNPCVIMY